MNWRGLRTGLWMLALLSVASAVRGDAQGASAEQRRLVVEGWRRLVMGPYDSRAAADHAWHPMIKAISLALEDRELWKRAEAGLKRHLDSVLGAAATPGREGLLSQWIAAYPSFIRGKDPILLVKILGACRAGDRPDGETRAPGVILLFWWEQGRLRCQTMYGLYGGGWRFDGPPGRCCREELLFAGTWERGNAPQPAIVVYREDGVHWRLVQRYRGREEGVAWFDDGAEATTPPDVRMMWYRWKDDTLRTPHAGPHRYYDEKWAFREGRYHRTSRWLVRTPFVALDDFYRALRGGDRTRSGTYAADPAIVRRAIDAGLADSKTHWRLCYREMAGGDWIGRLARDFDEPTLTVRMHKSNGRWLIIHISPIAAPTDAGGS